MSFECRVETFMLERIRGTGLYTEGEDLPKLGAMYVAGVEEGRHGLFPLRNSSTPTLQHESSLVKP